MELTARKKEILKVVTERYIDAAEPVSSKYIAQAMGGSVSSATIRNELADLVEMGYLEQPHRIIGKMKYRSSYGQNLLQHARETANLCAVMMWWRTVWWA